VLKLPPFTATQEFDELCFDYGIELDEDVCFYQALPASQSSLMLADHQTTKDVEAARAKGLPTPPPQLKIEIPANRYVLKLLCPRSRLS
jgi:phenylalanyl-tRNA synthetase beta chain